jgi:hypothetical protein
VNTFDYALPLLLILSVLRQARGKHLTWRQLAWPLGLVGWAAAKYLHGIPNTDANLALVISCAIVGAALGAGAGALTTIHRRRDGTLIAKATLATILLWTAGTLGRLVFGLYADHGGAHSIAAFSHGTAISARAWAPALILMALAEVIGRTVVLGVRAASAEAYPRER